MIRRFLDGTEPQRALVVFLVSACFWASSLFGDFVWDDVNNLVDSTLLRGWGAIVECFKHDAMWSARMNAAAISTYRPISLASFVVDYQIFGGSSVGYHLTSILWHGLASVVVYLVLRRFLDVLPAAAATLLWGMVPANAEAVAWVNGRSEIFALLFGGLGVLVATSRAGFVPRMLGAAPLLLGGMLGKESGVVFLAVAVLLGTEVRHQRTPTPRFWLRSLDVASLVAGLLALGGYLYIRHLVFGGHPLPGAAEKMSTPAEIAHILSQSASIILRCFETVAVPTRISVGYLYLWAKGLTTVDLVVAWTVLTAVLAGLVAMWWRGHRLPVLLLAWWVISIAPVLILVGRDWPGLSRWLYMGGPGLVTGVMLLLQRLPWPRVAPVVGGIYATVFTVQAQRSIQVWYDSGTLFERMIVEEPGERFGYLSLAWYYLRIERFPESEAMARKVLEVGPRGHDPMPFLVASVAAQDRCDEARKAIYEPNPMQSRPAWMMYAVGSCFSRAERTTDALAMYKDCAAADKGCAATTKTLEDQLAAARAPESALPSAPSTGPVSGGGSGADRLLDPIED
jgi:hypothetical protein